MATTDLTITITVPAIMVDRYTKSARSWLPPSYAGTTPIQDALKTNMQEFLCTAEMNLAAATQSDQSHSDVAANPITVV